MNENQEPLFDAVVPVFIEGEGETAIGVGKGYRDRETGHVHVEIEFNEVASQHLEGIFHIISTRSISFAGSEKVKEVSSYCTFGSCDNVPDHIGEHRCRCGKSVFEDAPDCQWHTQPTKMDEAAERAKCMANHPAGKKRMTSKDTCGEWADPHTNVTCDRPKGHEGNHERPRL